MLRVNSEFAAVAPAHFARQGRQRIDQRPQKRRLCLDRCRRRLPRGAMFDFQVNLGGHLPLRVTDRQIEAPHGRSFARLDRGNSNGRGRFVAGDFRQLQAFELLAFRSRPRCRARPSFVFGDKLFKMPPLGQHCGVGALQMLAAFVWALLSSKWAVCEAGGRSLSHRYVTDEQRSSRPIFNPPCGPQASWLSLPRCSPKAHKSNVKTALLQFREFQAKIRQTIYFIKNCFFYEQKIETTFMWRSFFSPASSAARRRSVSLTHSAGFPAVGFSWANLQRAYRLREREWKETNPVLLFALQMAVGAAVAAGTILALFAWSGAGL